MKNLENGEMYQRSRKYFDQLLYVRGSKDSKSMGEFLIDPGVTNIDYKALQHIVGHRKVVYLRCTSPLYR